MAGLTTRIRTRARYRKGLALVGVFTTVGVLLAHEGHTPLPSSGTQVDVVKGLVLLSAAARDALE